MNLANKLTLMRIFLVPIFLIFITIKNIPYATIIATIIFIVASLTDKLDGYIARSRNQITNLGKFMDPLADKLLVISALVALVEFQTIHTWVAMIIIAREFAVTGLRTVAASEGIVISASYYGKFKTATQMVAIILALINRTYDNVIIYYLTLISIGLAVIITIISGIDYFVKNKNILSTSK